MNADYKNWRSEMSNNNIDQYVNKIINGNCIEKMKKIPKETEEEA